MKILKILETVKNFIKKNKKLVTVVSAMFCAVVLVAGSIAGTIAYLTATTGTVSNTFTVGNIVIALSEAKADEYGAVADPTNRVTANTYKLIPGHQYKKDPTVYVQANSEACWLFVKVENGLDDIDGTSISDQIASNNWTPLAGVENVYYKSVDAATAKAGENFVVFSTFTLANDANVEAYKDKKINITAYAIQSNGLTDPNAAWTAGGWS